tara:strand:+ start:377 stop:583 length:207 start_codon:yes stop_codon:yes gene_type:complete
MYFQVIETKHEIHGVKIQKVEAENSAGNIRIAWVLRDKDNRIVLQEKYYKNLILEMMYETAESTKLWR